MAGISDACNGPLLDLLESGDDQPRITSFATFRPHIERVPAIVAFPGCRGTLAPVGDELPGLVSARTALHARTRAALAGKTRDRRGRCREAARWPVASHARSLHDTTARSARDYHGWSNSDFASAQPVGRARMSRRPYETAAQRARSRTIMRMLVELGLLDVKVIAHRHRTTKSPQQVKPGRLRSDPFAERLEIKSVVSSAWSPPASGGLRSCLISP